MIRFIRRRTDCLYPTNVMPFDGSSGHCSVSLGTYFNEIDDAMHPKIWHMRGRKTTMGRHEGIFFAV